MSTSIDAIGHKLQSLEERLVAENGSRDCVRSQIVGPSTSAITAAAVAQNRIPRPQQLGETTPPTRPRRTLNLPVIQPQQATETEIDKKLKKIMKQTGILKIDGESLKTDIKDLDYIGDLGSGTSGHVVKMRHKPSQTIIAVKQMRRTGNTEENKRILMDLDVVLKSHDCEYIVQCLGCFITDPDVWICMELMAMCFDKLLKLLKMPVPEEIIGKVTVATVKALSYLKQKHGVIHRDVKPSNILIDARGNIKLCDFGISGRLVDSKANTRSAGCAAYMAPERIDPSKLDYDIRADVWSLGITIVELATASSPYEGCKTDFEVLTKIIQTEPPGLPKDKSFSKEFQEFVSKCLKKDHQSRPKYPELLEQPFIKIYERKSVDVEGWFRSVCERSGQAAPQRRLTSQPEIKTTLPSSSSSVAVTAATTTPSSLNNRFGSGKLSQIPNYQCSNLNKINHQNAIQSTTVQQLQNISSISSSNSLNNGSANQQSKQQHQSSVPNKFESLPKNPPPPPPPVVSSAAATTVPTSSLPQPIVRSYVYQPLPRDTTNAYGQSANHNLKTTHDVSGCKDEADIVSEMNKMYVRSPFVQRKSDLRSSFDSGSSSNGVGYDESPKKQSMLSSLGHSLIRNLTTSPFSQRKVQQQPEGFWNVSNPPDGGGGIDYGTNSRRQYDGNRFSGGGGSASPSPIAGRKRFQTTVPIVNDGNSQYARLPGNTSPIVLQRFYHQQNQLREREREKQQYKREMNAVSTNPFLNSFIPKYHPSHQIPSQINQTTSQPIVSDSFGRNSSNSYVYSTSPATSHQNYEPSSSNYSSNIPVYSNHPVNGSPQQHRQQQYYTATTTLNSMPRKSSPDSPASNSYGNHGGTNSGYGIQNVYSNNLYGRTMTQTNTTKESNSSLKDDQGWFHSIAGVVKKQFASYVKLHLTSGDKNRDDNNRTTVHDSNYSSSSTSNNYVRTNNTTTTTIETMNALNNATTDPILSSTVPMAAILPEQPSSLPTLSTKYEDDVSPPPPPPSHLIGHQSKINGLRYQSFNSHPGSGGFDKRHRSPDPPPRYNRGQSPLLLRKNLLELGQTQGSPLLTRRYVTSSPPIPPPRRGCESVPGSPQHFRTRIHYTPEPQRRVYRTIDQ